MNWLKQKFLVFVDSGGILLSPATHDEETFFHSYTITKSQVNMGRKKIVIKVPFNLLWQK